MKKNVIAVIGGTAFLLSSALAFAGDASSSAVYIISPKDGETVKGPVTVQFGLKGWGVAPAGVAKENTGHHHLLVDVEAAPAAGAPIAKDDNHIHFGGGQTETTLKLTPGKHTLQLVLGDKDHVPVEGLASQVVTINVE